MVNGLEAPALREIMALQRAVELRGAFCVYQT